MGKQVRIIPRGIGAKNVADLELVHAFMAVSSVRLWVEEKRKEEEGRGPLVGESRWLSGGAGLKGERGGRVGAGGPEWAGAYGTESGRRGFRPKSLNWDFNCFSNFN